MRDATIYVVDDRPKITQLVNAALEEIGFLNVHIFYGPVALLDKYNPEAPPDLIISDYRMMPISGVEMVERLEALTPPERMPRVLIMSRFDVPKWEGDYLVMPFRNHMVIDAIQSYVLKLFEVSHSR